ncbi:MAG: hypothetical protein QNJ68_21230 [Microcoleaceae cyanobacterium MO_207.B10]|nr:hypothetical protein [Microcoleaceae cyanobacterium MO_207.B10]
MKWPIGYTKLTADSTLVRYTYSGPDASTSTATRKSEVRSQKSEALIGEALRILSLVTYFRHPALEIFEH